MVTRTHADPTSIVTVRKARKNYRCAAVWAHDPTIKAGELYVRIKITPGLGRGWSEEMVHVECAEAGVDFLHESA